MGWLFGCLFINKRVIQHQQTLLEGENRRCHEHSSKHRHPGHILTMMTARSVSRHHKNRPSSPHTLYSTSPSLSGNHDEPAVLTLTLGDPRQLSIHHERYPKTPITAATSWDCLGCGLVLTGPQHNQAQPELSTSRSYYCHRGSLDLVSLNFSQLSTQQHRASGSAFRFSSTAMGPR